MVDLTADNSPHLLVVRKQELRTLRSNYAESFSDGSMIRSVNTSFHTGGIDLRGPLPPPQPRRPDHMRPRIPRRNPEQMRAVVPYRFGNTAAAVP